MDIKPTTMMNIVHLINLRIVQFHICLFFIVKKKNKNGTLTVSFTSYCRLSIGKNEILFSQKSLVCNENALRHYNLLYRFYIGFEFNNDTATRIVHKAAELSLRSNHVSLFSFHQFSTETPTHFLMVKLY